MTQRTGIERQAAAARHGVDPDLVTRARQALLSNRAYADLAETFQALADPTRARIVHVLRQQPLCVSDLALVVGVAEPTVSQHLRLLRTLRIVQGHRAGKLVYYQLDDAHVRSLLDLALHHQRETDT